MGTNWFGSPCQHMGHYCRVIGWDVLLSLPKSTWSTFNPSHRSLPACNSGATHPSPAFHASHALNARGRGAVASGRGTSGRCGSGYFGLQDLGCGRVQEWWAHEIRRHPAYYGSTQAGGLGEQYRNCWVDLQGVGRIFPFFEGSEVFLVARSRLSISHFLFTWIGTA